MSTLKGALKQLVPPLLLQLLPHRPPVISFAGDYPSWEAASADARGYDAGAILERVVVATRQVVRGAAAYERDAVLFEHVEYSWPLLACLLQVALERGSLRVIDFGGSLGSTWRQNAKFLRRLSLPVAWRVVEQENFVAAGAEFADEVLSFAPSIAAAGAKDCDAVLFLGSLCYMADPLQCLAEAAASSARFLIIDRLPTLEGANDRISVQTVTEPIYPASYPIRLFAGATLLDRWLSAWRLIERWDCELQPDPRAVYQGFFLEKR